MREASLLILFFSDKLTSGEFYDSKWKHSFEYSLDLNFFLKKLTKIVKNLKPVLKPIQLKSVKSVVARSLWEKSLN